MSIRYEFNLVFNGPCTMAGSSVLDSMIVLYHHTNLTIATRLLTKHVPILIGYQKSGPFDRASVLADQTNDNIIRSPTRPNHRFPISYRLCKRVKELLASRMSPIELPVLQTSNRMTIEPRRRATPILTSRKTSSPLRTPSTPLCPLPLQKKKSVAETVIRRKNRSVSRYQIAFMAARFRIA